MRATLVLKLAIVATLDGVSHSYIRLHREQSRDIYVSSGVAEGAGVLATQNS
jgi:hypothetical protein